MKSQTPSRGAGARGARGADAAAAGFIPASSSPYFRQRDVARDSTASRCSSTVLGESSPASIIEIPASSPFRQREPSGLGSRMAPAGTVFRPPPAVACKRPSPGPLQLSDNDDDEDDLASSRADLQPTAFRTHLSAYAYNPIVEEEEVQKLRQIYDVFGNRFPPQTVREALRACGNDIEEALDWLQKSPSGRRLMASQHSLKSPVRHGHVSKVAPKNTSKAPISIPSSSPPLPSPSLKKKSRRRLVQGLRNRGGSPTAKTDDRPTAPPTDDVTVVNLVDSENEDAYEAERSPEPIDDGNSRVLTCINTSELAELAAITGLKESLLEPLVAKRPFSLLEQARRVSTTKKTGARKSSKVSVGEAAVAAVEVFLKAVSAIDTVVSRCESTAQTVKAITDTWDLDTFGCSRQSRSSTPNNENPPTPTSLGGSRYRRPPVPRQPKLMDGHCEMKPFQLFGLNWMTLLYSLDIGCILADEMGLGKTCQVISFICQLVGDYQPQAQGRRRPWPNLIVVPPSTYNNWLMEFEKFAPDLSVIGYRGSQSERAGIAWEVGREPEAYHVVLATYSQINSEEDIEAMQSFGLNAAVFDEGHKMKNPATKIYRDLRRIRAVWKVLLTGTPVQNNLLEMTSLLKFINPKMFDGCVEDIEHIFKQKVTIRDVSNGAFLYGERVRRARTILEPFILQRRKDQVLSAMPGKKTTVVQCEMSEAQRRVYDEYEAIFRMEPSRRTGARAGGARQNDQNNVWMQLRKAALHPLLFRRHFTREMVRQMAEILMERLPQSELHQPDLEHLVGELENCSDFELHLWCRDYRPLLGRFDLAPAALLESGKVRKVLELVDDYQRAGDRVLVFSKFSRLLELLREVLAREGIAHRVLMGNTDVAERQALIDEFNREASIPVFLLTTGAGGTGINLTAANKVIIFDPSDNPQDDIQAENRAHRLGQRRPVEVVRLMSAGSIEELLYRACQKKLELANKVTGALIEAADEADVAAPKMEDEVRRMMVEETMTPP